MLGNVTIRPWGAAGAELREVFLKRGITHVVQAILDAPMSLNPCGQDVWWRVPSEAEGSPSPGADRLASWNDVSISSVVDVRGGPSIRCCMLVILGGEPRVGWHRSR